MIHATFKTTKSILALSSILLITSMLQSAPFVYVANDGDTTVSVIDAATNVVIDTIDIGTYPQYNGLAITPDGKTVLVTAFNKTVIRIDVATNRRLLPDITVSDTPTSLAILPDGRYAYVSCDDSTVNRIDLTTNMVDTVITGFNTPYEISIAPNGLTAYVSNFPSNPNIMPIDLATNTLSPNPASIDEPWWSQVSPDNKYVYVCNAINNEVLQFDISNPLAPMLLNSISVGISPIGLVLTADGKTMYVTNSGDGTITPVDLSTPTSPIVQTSVSVGTRAAPWIIAITSDGNSAYISNNVTNGTVIKLDITNRLAPTVKATIAVGNKPAGLAITPFSLTPPTSVSGCKTKNVFMLQTDYINRLTWTAPSTALSPAPTSYNIYRDAGLTDLAGTSTTLEFYDHGRNPNTIYTYYITSVDSSGNQSQPASVTVTSPCQ